MKSQGKRLKILFVITQGVWGGAQRYVFDCASSLSQTHDITVAIGQEARLSDLQKKLQDQAPLVHIIPLTHLVRPLSPFHDLLALFELKKLYRTLQPDIVHLNSSKAGILGSLSNFFTDPSWKTVYTVHGWVFLEPLNAFTKWLYTELEKFTARFKQAFIVLSPEEKEVALSLHIPPQKIVVIPLGIVSPPERLSKSQARVQLFSGQKQVPAEGQWMGTIAGLYPAKGIDLLIEAVSKIKKDLSHTNFIIIGDGPEKNTLQKKAKQWGVNDVFFFVGKKENASVYLPAFDGFILPSKKEGQPYALLEAMSFHLPILATTVGGVQSLLRQYPLVELASPNSQSLAEALLPFLKQSQFKQLPSPSFPEVPSLPSLTEATEHVYYSLLESKVQQ